MSSDGHPPAPTSDQTQLLPPDAGPEASSSGAVTIATDAAEAIRFLNQATHPTRRWPGLTEPVDVYEVLGALSTLADRLQQTASQLSRFIEHWMKTGLLDVAFGEHTEDTPAAVNKATTALEDARVTAAKLAHLLSDAQATVIAMGTTTPPDG